MRSRLWRCAAALPLGGAALVIAGIPSASPALAAATTTFSYTGGEQSYSVPAGTTALTITAVGAPGGASFNAVPGGHGATVTATVPLSVGTTVLYVEVGGAGARGACFSAGGAFNGGGSTACGGGGGGASDIRTTSMSAVGDSALTSADDSRLVVAGGGGGGGYVCGTPGGSAGDTTVVGPGAGGAGSDLCGGASAAGNAGAGGTSGGAGGAGTSEYPCAGSSGSLGLGGDTALLCDATDYGGAGGGGFYGGGAGGDGYDSGGGGGAGSSFWTPAATATSVAVDGTDTPEVKITPIIPAADLSLVDPGPANVLSGTRYSYTVVATNSGASLAHDVVIVDDLPATTKYDSVSTTQGTCTRAAPTTPPKTKGGTVTCAVGDVPGGGSVTVTVTVMATTPGMAAENATVTADVVTVDADDVASMATLVRGS